MSNKMSWVKAAIHVLMESMTPLTAREIADKAISDGLRPANGDSPEYSVQAAISRDQRANGLSSQFETIARPGQQHLYRIKGSESFRS